LLASASSLAPVSDSVALLDLQKAKEESPECESAGNSTWCAACSLFQQARVQYKHLLSGVWHWQLSKLWRSLQQHSS